MSGKFADCDAALDYIKRHDEWLGYLQRKSLAGLRAQAQVALADRGLHPLAGKVDRTELLQLITGLSFPLLSEACQAVYDSGPPVTWLLPAPAGA